MVSPLSEDMPPRYDAIAEWYDECLRMGLPVHALALPAVHKLTGDVQGRKICDLGCGQGLFCQQLAQRGASVTGIDLSPAMLEQARQYADADIPRIVYKQGDAQTLPDVPDACFDGVTCVLALMDMPNLDNVCHTVSRILRPGGWFVFAITHPCFQTPDSRWTGKAGGTVKREVRGYFREGYWQSGDPNSVRGQVGAYHRTLSTYLNTLQGAGLVLEQMREPQAQDAIAGRVPGYREVPPVLAAKTIKRTNQSGSEGTGRE